MSSHTGRMHRVAVVQRDVEVAERPLTRLGVDDCPGQVEQVGHEDVLLAEPVVVQDEVRGLVPVDVDVDWYWNFDAGVSNGACVVTAKYADESAGVLVLREVRRHADVLEVRGRPASRLRQAPPPSRRALRALATGGRAARSRPRSRRCRRRGRRRPCRCRRLGAEVGAGQLERSGVGARGQREDGLPGSSSRPVAVPSTPAPAASGATTDGGSQEHPAAGVRRGSPAGR